ncbi:MAG: hypothetical protein JNK85_27120 [Verrucomicrobiales bacterium]|nr:hypothetical protein [Verrucomicrobiales bacterium]
MNHAAAVMPNDEESPRELESSGWDGEEVHANKAIPVIAEESLPTPKAIIGYQPFWKIPGDRVFIDDDAEFEQLAVNLRFRGFVNLPAE